MKHEYRELRIWQEARKLNKAIYELTDRFPKEEKYGLTSQMRRCSVSVPSNISEGSSYRSTKQFLRFLDIALGSLCELETQLYLASDVMYLTLETLEELISKTDILKRQILAFIKAIGS